MRRIYLDYNASTPIDPRVKQEMARASDIYGNASSIHEEGREARALLDEARVDLGRLLNCDHRQLVFTSGGTESNNLAILGATRAYREKGNHIITSAMEHSAVLNSCHQLQREGFEITFVSPTSGGMIQIESILNAIRPQTVLISIMMANNEVGTIQPIGEIGRLARERGILMHTDAVQALGKIPVNIAELDIDLLSISAHKIYGPKGAGALYFRSGVELMPLMRGGSHESGLRAGTENVAALHGFGIAARLLTKEGLPELMPLRQRLEAGLSKTSMKIICRDAPRLPNTINFYSESWLGESMVMAFDLEGVAVSNGSACSSGIIEPSHVMLSLGYNEEIARSVIRVSFGKFTTVEEIDYFLQVVDRLENIGTGVAR
jgi:cysteine desulfurase